MKDRYLTDAGIRHLIRQFQKGRPASEVAKGLGIAPPHARRLWAAYRETGKMPVPGKPGRPRRDIPEREVQAVVGLHGLCPAGAVRMTLRLQDLGWDISHRTVYSIMKTEGLSTPSPKKSRRHKWVLHERIHSNAMWHADWHVIKDPRLERANLLTFLDDASRCVTGWGIFDGQTSENTVLGLRNAISMFGCPTSILSDNGSCFVGVSSKKPRGSWQPTLFEAELLRNDIHLINSRAYHPQTNGKLERFFRTFEQVVPYFDAVDVYMGHYNEQRIHTSMDISRYEKPLEAFRRKMASEEYRKAHPHWMEEDIND